jgi:hypothetical protein
MGGPPGGGPPSCIIRRFFVGDPVEIKYKVEWWPKESMSGSLCDYCGEKLDEFPAAVVMYQDGEDPHALCISCRFESDIDLEDNEYFETLAYQAKEEPPMAGKNYGGRKTSA